MEQFRPLILSAKSKTWRMADSNYSTSDQEWSRLRSRVLQLHDFTCQFCGFKAKKWQEVHHLDDNHNNNSIENLVTACSFCHQCHHIGLAGMTNSARLAWIPELSLVEINHMIRSKLILNHWLTKIGQSGQIVEMNRLKAIITAVDTAVNARCNLIKNEFGSDNPTILGEAIIECADVFDNRESRLSGIRLVPTGTLFRGGDGGAMEDKIPTMVESWLEEQGTYKALHPKAWISTFQSYQERLGLEL